MEVDADTDSPSTSSEDKVLGSGSSSLSVSLHPLVIMNISDHYTRVKVQQGDSHPGPLIGTDPPAV